MSTARLWKKDEINFLLQNYNSLGADICALELGRTKSSVQHKASRLKIKDTSRFWSQEQINLLEQLYPILPPKDCAKILKKSVGAVHSKASRLKIRSYEAWTEQEDTILIQKYEKLGREECSKILNRTPLAIKYRVKCLGLKKDRIGNGGIQKGQKGYFYLLFFPELNIYKFGITKNLQNRVKQFGYTCVVLLTLTFIEGPESLVFEKRFSKKVKDLLVNTGLLHSGNTETFFWDLPAEDLIRHALV